MDNPFEPDILAFEAADRHNPPPQDAIVCVGSSTFTLWGTIGSDLAPLPVVNRGFGGSQLSDSVHYVRRIVIPYRPKVVALYAGDNDLANDKSPQRVARDFQLFAAELQDALPDTKLLYVSIKYSVARWDLIDRIRATNRLIAEQTRTDPRLDYIDTATSMLGPDLRPRRELFIDDLLHLSRLGYREWAEILRPALAKAFGAPS